MTYSDKLKDTRWQKKRLQILERDGWSCQSCYDPDNTLHVHHRIYRPKTDPWDYCDANFVTLCGKCHKIEHEDIENAQKALRLAVHIGEFLSHDIAVIARGLMDHKFRYPPEVVAAIIQTCFIDEGLCDQIVDMYFKHITIINKNRGLTNGKN